MFNRQDTIANFHIVPLDVNEIPDFAECSILSHNVIERHGRLRILYDLSVQLYPSRYICCVVLRTVSLLV